jgi:hypothetical protein
MIRDFALEMNRTIGGKEAINQIIKGASKCHRIVIGKRIAHSMVVISNKVGDSSRVTATTKGSRADMSRVVVVMNKDETAADQMIIDNRIIDKGTVITDEMNEISNMVGSRINLGNLAMTITEVVELRFGHQ